MTQPNRTADSDAVTEERQWCDGFMIHPPLAAFAVHKRYLRRLSDEQWTVAAGLLQQGLTLGVIANPNEAVDAVADMAPRLKVPLLAEYNEEDSMLYLALDGDGSNNQEPTP